MISLIGLTCLVAGTGARAQEAGPPNAEVVVRTRAELDAAITAAQPGDTIVMADGDWESIDIFFEEQGARFHSFVHTP